MIRGIGGALRSIGKSVDAIGVRLQGESTHIEKLVPSTRFVEAAGSSPQVHVDSFVSSSSSLVGDVTLGQDSAVWYGTVVKGDSGGSVKIGSHSHIFDNSMVEAGTSGSVVVGNGVMIGSCTTLGKGCEVKDGATVGSRATIGDGSTGNE